MRKTNGASALPEPLDRRYDVQDLSTVDAGVLETFPYEYPGKDIIIDIETDEFTAVCPFSGLPDFATIRVVYVPDERIAGRADPYLVVLDEKDNRCNGQTPEGRPVVQPREQRRHAAVEGCEDPRADRLGSQTLPDAEQMGSWGCRHRSMSGRQLPP